jgi:hypothetical protein
MKAAPAPAGLAEQSEKRSLLTTCMFGLLLIGWVAESPLLPGDGVTYHDHWRSLFVVFAPIMASVPGISVSVWQLLLLALLPFCLKTSQHSREMDQAIFASVACLAITFLWGLVRGGSAYYAYYQVWHFLAALLIAFQLMSAVRSKRDLVTLGKIVVLAALIRATLCIYYFWVHLYGQVDPLPDYVTNHDDSMLWVVAVLILGIWVLVKGGRVTWAIAGVSIPYILYAIVLNARRIAWVELGLAAALTYFLMDAGPLRSRINRWAIRALPLLLLYIILGWGSNSAVFEPVRALTTTGSNQDASSLTRLEEDRNLLHTLADIGNPVFGTGWGRPYDKLESIYSNYDPRWILYLYTPHNSLLGLAAFSGLIGVFGIWGVVTMGAYLGARGYMGSDNPVQRTAGMVAVGSLAVYGAHCYGDIGLQSFEGALILGAALATAGKVAAWSSAVPVPKPVTTRAGVGRPVPKPRFAYRKAAADLRRPELTSSKPGPSAGNNVTGKPGRTPMRSRRR